MACSILLKIEQVLANRDVGLIYPRLLSFMHSLEATATTSKAVTSGVTGVDSFPGLRSTPTVVTTGVLVSPDNDSTPITLLVTVLLVVAVASKLCIKHNNHE